MGKCWESCLQNLKGGIWFFFIEALLVPSFRSEWGKYKFWSPSTSPQALETIQHAKQVKRSVKRKLHLEHLTSLADGKLLPHDHGGCQRLKFNVSGRHYETQVRTLARYPHTLLGDPKRRLPFFDPKTQTFYFDRHRDSFEMILYYYQSGGRVVRPLSVEIEIFMGELIFFDLGEKVLFEYREQECLFVGSEIDEWDLPSNLLQRKIWLLFEYPESSPQSTVVAIMSIFAIVISISSFCLETLLIFDYTTTKFVPTPIDSMEVDMTPMDVSDIFVLIETVCVTWFTLELVVRLLASPLKLTFCTNIMNIMDFVAIVPFFVQLISSMNVNKSKRSISVNQVTYLTIFKVFRLVRVFRIFKLSRHSKGLQILGMTLHASLRELGLLIFFLLIGVILFSSAVYFAELDLGSKSHYESIPHAFYWGVVTMTTVGYGDLVPRTMAGKIIGGMCAVTGVLTIALPVPVIVSNFNFFYHRATDKGESGAGRNVNLNFVRMCPFLPDDNGMVPEVKKIELDTVDKINELEKMEFGGQGSVSSFDELKFKPENKK